MPIFHLAPVLAKMADPAWNTSRLRRECWVNGANEAEARELASGYCQDAAQTVPGEASPHSAWRDPMLVEATPMAHGPDNMSIPSGVVVVTSQS